MLPCKSLVKSIKSLNIEIIFILMHTHTHTLIKNREEKKLGKTRFDLTVLPTKNNQFLKHEIQGMIYMYHKQ